MYQVIARSCKAVTNFAFFILSLVTFFVVHTAFATNQNCSKSSLPIPLNMSIFISFSMINGGGGGRGGGEGVCSGGGGGWMRYPRNTLSY